MPKTREAGLSMRCYSRTREHGRPLYSKIDQGKNGDNKVKTETQQLVGGGADETRHFRDEISPFFVSARRTAILE